MAVEVAFNDGTNAMYPAGSWTVDEDGHLHLVKQDGRGNVATVSKGSWQCVRALDAPALTFDGADVARSVGDAVNAAIARGWRDKGGRR